MHGFGIHGGGIGIIGGGIQLTIIPVRLIMEKL
jgi:hypothetical protein